MRTRSQVSTSKEKSPSAPKALKVKKGKPSPGPKARKGKKVEPSPSPAPKASKKGSSKGKGRPQSNSKETSQIVSNKEEEKKKRKKKGRGTKEDSPELRDLSIVLHRIDDESISAATTPKASIPKGAILGPSPSSKAVLKKRPRRKKTLVETQKDHKDVAPVNPPAKKPIYANAINSWNESVNAENVYDVVVESDETYTPSVKRKRKPRRAPLKKNKLPQSKNLKSLAKRLPLQEKPIVLNSKVNESTLSVASPTQTLRESFTVSVPCSIREVEDVPDEFCCDPPLLQSPQAEHSLSNKLSRAIDKSVRLSTFKKGTFSSSTPDRKNVMSLHVPSKHVEVPNPKMSTPKPVSIKEQIQNCFGFDESEEGSELFGEISQSVIVHRQKDHLPGNTSLSLDSYTVGKATQINPSLFKVPKALPRPSRTSKQPSKLTKPKGANMNSTLLFEDLENDEEEKKVPCPTVKQKSMLSFVQPIVSEVQVDTESENEDEEALHEVTPPTKSEIKKRKRNSNSSSGPSPKQTRKEDEEFHNWEKNQSLEFSQIDNFDLTFS